MINKLYSTAVRKTENSNTCFEILHLPSLSLNFKLCN